MAIDDCPSGTVTEFQQVFGHELVGADTSTKTGISESDCLDQCKSNKVSDLLDKKTIKIQSH